MKREPTYVGIDVAKDRVDIAVRPTGQSWSASYEEEEVEILVARLQVLEPAGVILEATGGLELTLVAALAAASLPVQWSIPAKCVISPGPPANWPRTTDSTPRSWPTLERRSNRRCARYVMPTLGSSERCWPVGVK